MDAKGNSHKDLGGRKYVLLFHSCFSTLLKYSARITTLDYSMAVAKWLWTILNSAYFLIIQRTFRPGASNSFKSKDNHDSISRFSCSSFPCLTPTPLVMQGTLAEPPLRQLYRHNQNDYASRVCDIETCFFQNVYRVLVVGYRFCSLDCNRYALKGWMKYISIFRWYLKCLCDQDTFNAWVIEINIFYLSLRCL